MIFPKAKKIARELNWHKTKDGVFGLYKGYFFNVTDASLLSNPQYKFVSITTEHLTDEQIRDISTELNTHKKNLKFTTFEFLENRIFFQFAENLSYTKLKTVYSLFDFLVDLFRKLQLPEQNRCHHCGSEEKNALYNLNESGIILCKTCFNKTEKSFYELERERIFEEKNYLTGFLGAIVFSMPGIIAWVLIAVYLETLASAIAMVIAVLGMKGYEYFKGRQGQFTKYIVVVANVVCILIANAATVITLLLNGGFTLNEAFDEFQTNQAVRDIFVENTIVSFVLASFVWIWLLFVLKEHQMSIKPAEKVE